MVVGTLKAVNYARLMLLWELNFCLIETNRWRLSAYGLGLRHSPGKLEPELTFPNPQPFNELITKPCGKLEEIQGSGELDELHFARLRMEKN